MSHPKQCQEAIRGVDTDTNAQRTTLDSKEPDLGHGPGIGIDSGCFNSYHTKFIFKLNKKTQPLSVPGASL